MDTIVLFVGVVFGCGLAAHAIRLPPLIGFLAAGFILNAAGAPELTGLTLMADIGVTLMLFAIGLRLDLRTLADKMVWVTAGAHMLLMTVIGTGFLAALAALGVFGPEQLSVLVVLALVLSFSSTIFVVKVLQERGDEQSLYGSICIGVLIMQDIAAVVVISLSRGEAPSIYALGLFVLIPALAYATRSWHRLGHGELGSLFGIAMALAPGYALFEWLGLSGSLGALIMGLVLAPRTGSEELAHNLFTLKELLLVGFFVSVGFEGLPTLHNVVVGLLLLLLLPIQALAYWLLQWLLGLRNRTSVLASLLLSNYSEFALIVAAILVGTGALGPEWLPSLVIAVSAGFVLSAIVNPLRVSVALAWARRLPSRPVEKLHSQDRPIGIGDANAVVLGMGRVGRASYRQLAQEHHYSVLGVDHDAQRVEALIAQGLNVIEGDATDDDFFTRVRRTPLVKIVVLAMPSQQANLVALRLLRDNGFAGTVVAVALYREDVEQLQHLGLDAVINLYAGAGRTLADRAVEAAVRRADSPAPGAGAG